MMLDFGGHDAQAQSTDDHAAEVLGDYRSFRRELRLCIDRYNEHPPNTRLGGCTPHQIYHRSHPANRHPRCELRHRWPRCSQFAAPQTLVAGQPGAQFELNLRLVAGRQHLKRVVSPILQ